MKSAKFTCLFYTRLKNPALIVTRLDDKHKLLGKFREKFENF